MVRWWKYGFQYISTSLTILIQPSSYLLLTYLLFFQLPLQNRHLSTLQLVQLAKCLHLFFVFLILSIHQPIVLLFEPIDFGLTEVTVRAFLHLLTSIGTPIRLPIMANLLIEEPINLLVEFPELM